MITKLTARSVSGKKSSSRWRTLTLALMAAPLPYFAHMPVYAQDNAQATASDSDIETVVVSARKREEQLINVPVAATVLGTAQIDRYEATDLTAIGNLVPDVDFRHSGGGSSGAALSIRGVGSLATDYGNEQPVALDIEGMPITRGHAIDMGMFDLASVQVLKGPQALFFGKNSPAGVVSIRGVDPGDTFEGYMRVGYEAISDNPYVEGAVSVPLSDTFAVRVAVRYTDMLGGFYDNKAKSIVDPFDPATFGGAPAGYVIPAPAYPNGPESRSLIGRVTAVWKPTSNFDATLKVIGDQYHNDGDSIGAEVSNCAPGQTNPSVVNQLNPAKTATDPFQNCTVDRNISNSLGPTQVLQHLQLPFSTSDLKPFGQDNMLLTTLTMNYTFDEMTLTSVTGYYNAIETGFDNYDFTVYGQALDGQKDDNKSLTQELRLASSFEGPLNFTMGGFYEYDHRTLANATKIFPLGPYPVPGPFQGITDSLEMGANNRGVSYSVFGELTWKILSNLELSGGARWSHDYKSTDIGNTFNVLSIVLPAAANPFAPAGVVFHPKISEDNLSPEATLTWHPASDTTVYGAYKTGYLAGSPSNPGTVSNYQVLCAKDPTCTNPSNLLNYRDEVVKGFEFGAKASELDDRLSGDITFYHYNYSQLQVTVFDPPTNSFFTQNAAGALNQGVELQAAYQATDQLSIHGYTTYTELKFTNYTGAQCYPLQTVALGCNTATKTQDLSGHSYGGPPLEVNLGAVYDQIPITSNWTGAVTGDVYFHSRAPKQNANIFATGSNPYTTINLSLRAQNEDDSWEAALIGTNLTNAEYYLSGLGKPLGRVGDLDVAQPPSRQITVQLTHHF